MDYKIEGTTMPSLEIRLQQGDAVYTESGGMAWMTNGIKMDTNSRGGIGKMFGRALAGESLFLTTYTCEAPQALIVFTMESPGTILPVELACDFYKRCARSR
ncbi:MAG: AIM24 family protein [Chloroflexota bacterium]